MGNAAFLNADNTLYTGLKLFGHSSFRPGQEAVIRHAMEGGDALVIMPTGGGKSLCYQLAGELRTGTTIVISPLIALMNDQIGSLKQKGLKAEAWHSDLPVREIRRIQEQLSTGQLDFLYLSPERFTHLEMLPLIKQSPIALLAIDEAHCVSMWGHDFRPAYLALKSSIAQLRALRPFPILAMTATADRTTQREILDQLGLHAAKVFLGSFERKNIQVTMTERPKEAAFRTQLLKELRQLQGAAAIVYCQSRQATEDLSVWLNKKNIAARSYHAGMARDERRTTHEDFLKGDCQVVCATIAFGMGIDHPHIRLVVHAQLPRSIEAYYQEIGRAGRDGEPAHAILYCGKRERAVHRYLIRQSRAQLQQKQIELFKLEAMECLAHAPVCKMLLVRQYFGETAGACGQCCVCRDGGQWSETINIDEQVKNFIKLAHAQERPRGWDWWLRELMLQKDWLKNLWSLDKSRSQKAMRQRARYFLHYLFLHHIIRWSKQGDGHSLIQLTPVALQVLQGLKTVSLPQHRFLLG